MAKQKFETTVTHKVKIITPAGKYSNQPYRYAVPMSSSKRLPVTGQEDVIMTPEKWTGKEKLTTDEKNKLQMGVNPYIINPDVHIIINHGQEYDNSYVQYMEKEDGGEVSEIARVYKNPKDHAELTAIMAGSESPVAKSKSLYRKNKHAFYVEDKELEAKQEVEKYDQVFEAEKFVRDTLGSGRWSEVVLLLQHEVPEYKITPGILSDTKMKAIILKGCKEHPEIILKMNGIDATRTIFALKLIKNQLITRRKNMDFYYGDNLIGPSIDSIKLFMENKLNAGIMTKWQKQIEFKEGKLEEVNG